MIITAFFVLNTIMLVVNLFGYLPFIKRNIPFLKKCMWFTFLGILQSLCGFLSAVLPQGTMFRFFLTLLPLFSYLSNVLFAQLILGMLGFDTEKNIRVQRLFYLLPIAGALAAVTNPYHHLFLSTVEKIGTYEKMLVLGPIGVVLSTVSLALLGFVFVLSVFVRREKGLRPGVIVLLVLCSFIPSAVGGLETLLEPVIGGNYGINIYVFWIPVIIIFYVYFGYLKTARRNAVQAMTEAYLLFDKRGVLVDSNREGEKMLLQFGLSKNTSLAAFDELISSEEEERLDEREFVVKWKDKSVHYYRINTFPISDGISQYCGDGYVVQEITDFKERMAKLNLLAVKDPLTGVGNRRFFQEYSENVLQGALLEKTPLSVMLLDIDYFKRINDTYGHSVGDEVLIDLCETCVEKLRQEDALFRYGGEEFVVVSSNTGADTARMMAERLHNAVRERVFDTSVGQLSVTISIGVCTMVPQSGDTIERWVDIADNYMYKAKQQGRNRVVYK